MSGIDILILIIVGALAFAIGFFLGPQIARQKHRENLEKAKRELHAVESEKKELLIEAKDEALKIKQKAEQDINELRKQIGRDQQRISQKETSLDKRYESIEQKLLSIAQKNEDLVQQKQQLEEQKASIVEKLESVAEMTREQAKDELLARVEDDIKEDALRLINEVEEATKEEADRKARGIIALAMQRCVSDYAGDMTVSSVPIPSDDMKGRIIGKEGRNIRCLERHTGVDIIVDDTPKAITISSFAPLRRKIAEVALTKLVADGRIHPARIEEVVDKAQKDVDQMVIQAGKQAAMDAKVPGLPLEVIKLLGQLKFRYSYGQNVLHHSVEAAHLAAMIAHEIGADVTISRTATLLHDIGKAIDHKFEGTHTQLGADFLERFGLNPRVVYAVRAHHEDIPLKNVEDYVVIVADAISGARPGARYDTMENYIERLRNLEEIGNQVSGVDKCYAIQAGRELRLLVNPQKVDDLKIKKIAKNVARKIHDTLDYPGQIKVNVIRETRAVGYAK